MQSLIADLRHGLRLLVRSPGFTLVAVLSLAVGIGANTAIFSLINSILLQPLPFERPHELISIFTSDFSGPLFGASSYPDFVDFKAQTRAMADLAAQGPLQAAVVSGDRTERAVAMLVTGNYFELLGVKAAAGRALSPPDDDPSADAVAVLSDRFWRRLGADIGLVGKPIAINSRAFTIAGVAPASFWSGALPGIESDLWVPAATIDRLSGGPNVFAERGSRRWLITGRLVRAATVEQVQAALAGLPGQLSQQYPQTWLDLRREPRRVTVTPLSRVSPIIRGIITGFSALLMIVVGLVLLISCANVANLLLARAEGRTREIAVRLSLGAGRGRLIRQLITESLVLSIVAGVAGLILAFWFTRAIDAFQPPLPLPVPLEPSLDGGVLLFTLALSLLTGLVFGLVPALHATRPDLVTALKSETSGNTGRRRFSAGQALVIGQVALSLLLLVTAGLFIRTLQQSTLVPIGFDPDGVALTSIDLTGMQPTPEQSELYFQALLERLRRLPDVDRVAIAALVPFGPTSRRGIQVEGYQFRPGEDTEQHYNVVTPDYFLALRIPIVNGRGFADGDRAGAPPVVMINETFARRFWPNDNPIGKRIKVNGAGGPWSEVVGVTKDGHYVSLLAETLPYFFVPLAQTMRSSVTVFVRTNGSSPGLMLPAIRSAVRDLNANVSTFDAQFLTDRVGAGLTPMRLAASALGAFGTIAMLLAAIGLYGVMAHGVNQRRREIGVRVALGAEPRAVRALFVSQGMRIVAIGLVVGWAGAFAATRLLSSFLYGISPTDPVTFAATSAVLALVAFAATYLPARRAAALDPIRALRE